MSIVIFKKFKKFFGKFYRDINGFSGETKRGCEGLWETAVVVSEGAGKMPAVHKKKDKKYRKRVQKVLDKRTGKC